MTKSTTRRPKNKEERKEDIGEKERLTESTLIPRSFSFYVLVEHLARKKEKRIYPTGRRNKI